jgi:O-antigen ligase
MKNNYITFTQTAAIYFIVLACFSVNLPTAFMSVASALFFIFFLISGDYKLKLERIYKNPGAVIAVVFLIAYGIGLTYTSAPHQYAFNFFLKYDKLLFIPILVGLLTSDKHRKYCINAFLICTLIVLIISYLKWLGIYPHTDIGQGFSVNKGRIAGSIIMSFGAYLMLARAKNTKGSHRSFWILASMLAIGNVLFLVNGRTGQVTLAALLIWFSYEHFGLRAIKYWIAVILLGLTFHHFNPNYPNSRLTGISAELASENKNTGAQTAAGLRLEFYQNTLTLIKKHPLIGGGTGSLENEYFALVEKTKIIQKRVPNPHNQYLLTTQELGLVGLVLLLAFWLTHWWQSYKLKSTEDGTILRGLIITITVGSLFNSLLLDASEGKFYCLMAGVFLSSFSPNKAIKNQTK